MLDQSINTRLPERVLIRLDTLIRLRWYAIIGQAGAVIVIAFGFGYPMQWALCLLLIVFSASLNVFLGMRYRANHRLPSESAFMLLAFDVLQLGNLLFLTGGLQNPFTILLMAPVIVSSTSLYRKHILLLGILAVSIITLLGFFHLPLPWDEAAPLKLPNLFIAGVWVAVTCTLSFTTIYCYRVAQETRKLANALSATELVLQREQHLHALDGLAAAAAHELGTPLATIAVVSKEMLRDLPTDNPQHEDAKLLHEQTQRCRDILQKLKSLNSEDAEMIQSQSLAAVVEEAVAPLRSLGIKINIATDGDKGTAPKMIRNPGLHYAIGNIIENAVDFADSIVDIKTRWDDKTVTMVVDDDGRGFASDIISRLGEPFVSTRGADARRKERSTQDSGLGLGLFIAKTLIERNGAQIAFSNRNPSAINKGGARVTIIWNREVLDKPA